MTIQEANQLKGFAKFKAYSGMMGPAWMAIALNIGGATAANAGGVGSRTGFQFLWTIPPQVFTIVMICILFSTLTLHTKKTPIGLAREHFGEIGAWVTAICVFIVNAVFHVIQYAIIGNIMNTLFGVTPKIGSVIGFLFVVVVAMNPLKGETMVNVINKVLQWMVWILLASFLLVFIIVPIDWAGFFGGFVPNMSGGYASIVTVCGLMGSVLAINVPTLAAYGAHQQNWGDERLGLSRFETIYTNILLIIVQIVIIGSCASVLYPQGVVITGAGTMAAVFEPIAGRFATILLCIGLLGSVLSTMVSQCLVSGYIITDILGWEADLTAKRFKISEFVVTLFGVIVPLIGWNAFAVSSYGSGFNLTFFPIVSIMMLIIANKKDVMGDKKASTLFNVLCIIAILFSLLATWNFWRGIFAA